MKYKILTLALVSIFAMLAIPATTAYWAPGYEPPGPHFIKGVVNVNWHYQMSSGYYGQAWSLDKSVLPLGYTNLYVRFHIHSSPFTGYGCVAFYHQLPGNEMWCVDGNPYPGNDGWSSMVDAHEVNLIYLQRGSASSPLSADIVQIEWRAVLVPEPPNDI